MKKHVIVAALMLLFFNLNAQTYETMYNYIGIKGGLSIPNLTAGGSGENELSSGYHSKTGLNFAIFYEKAISGRFSLSTQLEYAAQGGKKDGYQAFPTPAQLAPYFIIQNRTVPDVVYANFNSEIKINYLTLSELAKFNFPFSNLPVSFYAEAGPFVGFLLSAHQVVNGNSDVYADKDMMENITGNVGVGPQSLDSTQNLKDLLHKSNFGIEGDIGFAFNLANSKIFIEGGGNYGFLTIQKGTENGKNHIGAGTIRIGYAYAF